MKDRDKQQPPLIIEATSSRKFAAMIFASVCLALLVVVMSMSLYFSSGTSLLDLSRPGYQSLKGQIKQEESFDAFSSSGPIDKATLNSFKKMYDKRADDATALDAFGGDPLSDDALSIDDAPN